MRSAFLAEAERLFDATPFKVSVDRGPEVQVLQGVEVQICKAADLNRCWKSYVTRKVGLGRACKITPEEVIARLGKWIVKGPRQCFVFFDGVDEMA